MATSERKREGRDRHGAAFVTGAAIGGAAGAVWGLLNATETGAAARENLGRAAYRALDGLVVSAADAEVALRAWLARDEVRDPDAAARGFAWPAAGEGSDPDAVVLGGETWVGEAVAAGPGSNTGSAVEGSSDGSRPGAGRSGGAGAAGG